MGNEKTETRNNRPEKPLFSIYLPESAADGKRKPRIGKTVSGYFKQFNHDYVFCPDSQDDDDDDDFCWTIAPERQLEMGLITMEEIAGIVGRGWKIEPDCGFESLFDYYSEENQRVELIGRQNRKHTSFRVYEIEMPHSGKEPFSVGSSDLLDLCCSQLKKHRDCSYKPVEESRRPRLRRKEDFAAYYQVCRHTLPDWVANAMRKELLYLEQPHLSSTNKEHALTALRYLTAIDWEKKDFTVPELESAKRRMDDTLYGLEEVKTRVLEILAAIQVSQRLPAWGILLYGPPGVGKTVISQLIAELLNRPLVELTESGQGNIGGSERVFQNGRPGFLVEKMAEAGTSSIVFVVQELDKLSNQKSGTEGAGLSLDDLLSVADTQGFADRFMEQIIPTDGIFLICTCNDITKLSAPLRNRFECIAIPDYTSAEKETILKQYLWPKAIKKYGLEENQFVLGDTECKMLVQNYAGDTGVRNLERAVERLFGDYCRKLLIAGRNYRNTVSVSEAEKLLGCSRRQDRIPEKAGEVNTVICIQNAAQMILMEASASPGTGRFQVYGTETRKQRDYISVAYECVRNITPIDVSAMDVSVFAELPQILYGDGDIPNSIGCAAFAAICCAVRDLVPNPDVVFFGGVGLNGQLYDDTEDIRPLARELAKRGVKLLFGPVGIGQKLAQADHTLENLITVEAKDIYDLLSTVIEFQRRY